MAKPKTQRLPVVGTAELGQLLRVSQPRVYQIVRSKDFPQPWARLRATQIWLMDDIEKWADKRKRTITPLPADWTTRGTAASKDSPKLTRTSR